MKGERRKVEKGEGGKERKVKEEGTGRWRRKGEEGEGEKKRMVEEKGKGLEEDGGGREKRVKGEKERRAEKYSGAKKKPEEGEWRKKRWSSRLSGSFDYSQASLHTFFAESGEVIMDVVEDVFSHDGILLKRRRRQQSGVFEMRANVFLVNYAFNDVDQLVPRLGAWRRRRRRRRRRTMGSRRRIIGYYGTDATICQAHLFLSTHLG